MDPIAMMVASIGMQFFNHYANSKKNEEIQEKQREFQRAAAEHDFERMRKLQAESAKLALELEAEVHKERVEDINNNYDALLDNFAHSFAIQNWPLNVLPFVMKGESFGTLFNGTTQSVNLHCILTPSNCEWFNREFYDDIDLRLEAEMNNKWNAQTTHPIVYYGGAWNRRSMNRGISVPNVVDLDDIELLRIKLKDVPVVVITPYFDPWLHFKVKLWGMGKDSEAPYRIDIPHGNSIKYSQRIFSYDYHKDDTELTEDFENTTIEEFVPYLECLIGFIADKYFWEMYNISPKLPSILEKNTNIPLLLKPTIINRYKVLPCEEMDSLTSINKNLKYLKDILNGVHIYSKEENCKILCQLHNKFINIIGGKDNLDFSNLNILKEIKRLSLDTSLCNTVQTEIELIYSNEDIEVWFCANRNELLQRIINKHRKYKIDAEKFYIDPKNQFVATGAFLNAQNEIVYSSENIGNYIILMDNHNNNKDSYVLDVSTCTSYNYSIKSIINDIDYSQLEKIYNDKTIWLNTLIEQHRSMNKIVSAYLADAPVRNVCYQDLENWSLTHANHSINVNFVIGYDPKVALYYIVGLTSNRKSVYASYCNTLDENLIMRFGKDLLLTIKTTKNGI